MFTCLNQATTSEKWGHHWGDRRSLVWIDHSKFSTWFCYKFSNIGHQFQLKLASIIDQIKCRIFAAQLSKLVHTNICVLLFFAVVKWCHVLGADHFCLVKKQTGTNWNGHLNYLLQWVWCGQLFPDPLTFLVSVAGKDLLVHPVTEEGARGVTAYLPGKDEVGGRVFYSFVKKTSFYLIQRQ